MTSTEVEIWNDELRQKEVRYVFNKPVKVWVNDHLLYDSTTEEDKQKEKLSNDAD